MKPEEAVERINEHIAIHRYNEPQAIRIAEALQMGIDALEKQIPKPPKSIKEDYNEYMDLYCPTCGHDVGMYDAETGYSYMDNKSNPRMCAKCGQLLFAKLEGE